MKKTAAAFLCAIVLGPALLASEPKVEINLVVDLTPAGRNLQHPTKAKPVYYLPIVGGYRQKGASVAGEDPPPPATAIVHALAKTLANEGYRVVEPTTPPPSILLTFHWGYIGAIVEDNYAYGGKTLVNCQDMLSLVAGGTYQNLNWFSEQPEAMNAAEEDRYYLIIAAYDFAAAKEHKKKLLWSAKVSTQMGGVKLSEVMPAFLTSAGPWLGRETRFAKKQMLPLAREGTVELGTPTVSPK